MNNEDFQAFSDNLDDVARTLYRYDLPPLAIALYWKLLKDRCDINQFQTALAAHVVDTTSMSNGNKRGDFMPKPADLISQIEIQSGKSRDPSRAWISVESAIRRVGKNRSVNFDDPAIHLTIEALGGWIRLCETLKEDDYVLRKSFSEISKELYSSAAQAPDYLLGIEDAHNRHLSETHKINVISINRPKNNQNLIGNN